MKGTEKQIAWATEIRDNVVRTLDGACDEIKKNEPDALDSVTFYQARKTALLNDSVYAGDIINLFKDCKFNGDIYHDLVEVRSVYRIRKAGSNGEVDILGRA